MTLAAEEMFSFIKDVEGDRTVFQMHGVIDERTKLDNLFDELATKAVTINLKGVKRMNSTGVRSWINTIKALSTDIDLEYTECSSSVVLQLNMIRNFLKPGKLISFCAPYYCEECDKAHELIINIEESFPTPEDREEPEAPEFKCPDCNNDMELDPDADEDMYFLFLRPQ